MSLKGTVLSLAVVASPCVLGCGRETGALEPVGTEDAGPIESEEVDAGGQTYSFTATLAALDAEHDLSALPPHTVIAIHRDTGEPLSPPVASLSEPDTGKVILSGIPVDFPLAIHIKGIGPIEELTSTYDTVILSLGAGEGDQQLYISTLAEALTREWWVGFPHVDDRASVWGTVYWTKLGVRAGTVGCVRVIVDDNSEAATEMDLIYNAASGVPAPPARQKETSRDGVFYLGNAPKGAHKLQAVSASGEPLGASEIFVPLSRSEAASPFRDVLVQVAIELEAELDPTPEACPHQARRASAL